VSPGYAFAWRVFPGGTQIWDIVAAGKRLKAEKYNMQAVTQSEVAAAAEAYFDFLLTYLMRDANITSMQEAKALIELDEKLLAENKITLQELEQAKALYQERYHDLAVGGKVVLNMQILLHRLNLDTTVGLSPDFQDYRLLQVVPKSLTSDSVLAYAKEHNLELKQLTELVSAQKWVVGSAVSAFVPYVDLGYTSAWIGSDYDNLQRFQNRAYTISTDLGYTMGVAPTALLAEQVIKVKQLKLEKLNTIRELETKLLQNYVGAISAEADYEFQKKAYEASEKAFKEGWQQLQNGEKVHLSVIASLNNLQQTRIGMAQATLNANNAQIQLLTDMGAATKENLLNGFVLPLPKKSK
jgi:outer membrane protein TolC